MNASAAKRVQEALARLSPRQAAFATSWTDPKSPTFGNAYASAVAAGYSDSYAKSISSRLSENVEESFEELLEVAGVTDKRLTERLSHLLESHHGNDVAKALELGLKLRGRLQQGGPTLNVNVLSLGVKDESEARRLVDLGREVEELTPAECAADAVTVLKAYLSDHPDDRTRILQELA